MKSQIVNVVYYYRLPTRILEMYVKQNTIYVYRLVILHINIVQNTGLSILPVTYTRIHNFKLYYKTVKRK